MSLFSSPLMLGFDEIERRIERFNRVSNGYPPYNIERVHASSTQGVDKLVITLAVAGFSKNDLDVTSQDDQLIITGQKSEEENAEIDILHKGIAGRQFRRVFLLAEGTEVKAADLADGLLKIELIRRQPDKIIKKIDIKGRK